MHPFLSPYLLQPSPAISPDDVTLFMVNRYTLHSSPVQILHTKDAIFMVTSQNVIADIIHCSEGDLPTTPWRFPLSFIPFLVLYIFLRKVRILPKVTIACNGFCLLRHTKAWLARDIISLIQWHDVFACTLLHREFRDYSLGQIAFVFSSVICYHTGALSCKRVVNKHNYYVSACNILCAY